MKIAVLLSGGVDSSVALRLLEAENRHDITAFYLKIWLEEEVRFLGDCPWQEDLEYARAVCEEAGVPLEIVSLQREYYAKVVEYALSELRLGRTPSADIFCNRRIKFGLFRDKISPDFEKIASGHYAMLEQKGNSLLLKKSPDPVKDQTYFLSYQTREQLSRSLFPIGHLYKDQVRKLAGEFDLPNRDRKDSQGICFLGKIKYPDFVRYYLGEQPGDIVDGDTGAVLGGHNGYWFYTIGQRKGLGLSGGPWYVSGKDVEKNRIYVSHGDRAEDLARQDFTVSNLHWINGPPAKSGNLTAKIRHGPEATPCTIAPSEAGGLYVHLERSDRGVAPGQFCVFYSGDVCLGAGSIDDR